MVDEEVAEVEGGEFSEDAQPAEPESLEDIAEEQPEMREADTFSEQMFSDTGNMPTLTLDSEAPPETISETPTQQPEQNLEQIGASSTIADAPQKTQKPEEDYVNVYNEPDYQGSRSEETVFDHMKERGMAAQNLEDLRTSHRAVRFEEYPELQQARESSQGQNLRDYAVMEIGQRQDDHIKSPLERKRDYRPLKRGKAA